MPVAFVFVFYYPLRHPRGIFVSMQKLCNACPDLLSVCTPTHASIPNSYLGLARLGPALRALQIGSARVAD